MKRIPSSLIFSVLLLATPTQAQHATPTIPPAMSRQSSMAAVPAPPQMPQPSTWPTTSTSAGIPIQAQPQAPAQQYSNEPALLPPQVALFARALPASQTTSSPQHDAAVQPAFYQSVANAPALPAAAPQATYSLAPSQQFPTQQIAYQQPIAPVPPLPGYAPAPVVAAPAASDPVLSQMQQQLYQLQQELAAIRAQQAQAHNPVDATPRANAPRFDGEIEQAEYAEDKGSGEKKKPEDPKAMSGKWNNQLEFSSKDKNFKIHVGGRTQLDAVFYQDSPAGFAGAGGVGDQDAVDFRRARLRVDGTMYQYYDFACEYDFVNSVNDNVGLQPPSDTTGNIINVPAPTDLWVQAREVPILGNVRIGNMKSPIGLEHVQSSRFLDFMERSYNQDLFWGAFNNGFTPGIMAYDNYAGENGYWGIGMFKNTTNAFAFDTGDGEYDVTGRITYLPFYECQGEYLMHLGLGGSHRDTNDNRTRFRTRGSLRNGPGALNPVFADTGTFFAESQSLISPEFALVWGPWLLQAEYTGCWVPDAVGNAGAANNVNQGTVYFQAWYAEALVFLTGEHREYERKEARFGRVIPHQNGHIVQKNCGDPWYCCPGAWQLGARYQKADLSDEGIRGGTTQDVTIGLNWFLNPNIKYQFNYVWTHRESTAPEGSGNINGFGARLAFDF